MNCELSNCPCSNHCCFYCLYITRHWIHDIFHEIWYTVLVPNIGYELWTLYLHVLLFFSNLGDLWTTFRNLAENHKTTEMYSVLQDKRFTSNGIHIKLYFGKLYQSAFYEKKNSIIFHNQYVNISCTCIRMKKKSNKGMI